ncbi:hypothetical protein H7X87_03890 [Acetobacteraceae bacterium]|nr:hypothetical protein [Candidatus Parcubacteria bacterium]
MNIRNALGATAILFLFLVMVMPVSASSDPVVIVPDVFASWPSDTGLVTDPVFNTYKNLVDTFTSNGYTLNQSLFVFPYDWEKSNITIGQALHNKIDQIKAICGCTQVDVIAHGAGGNVVQQYIDSDAYADDVDQLVLLGTPLLGAPGAYLAVEGGKINFGNPLSDGFTQAFLDEKARDGGFANTFDYITLSPVASLSEMLPLYNYLFEPGPTPIPYPNGYPENPYLIGLLTNFNDNLIAGNVHLTTVLADDQAVGTQTGFIIQPSTESPLWPHGEPVSVVADSGDGFTPRVSIEGFATVNKEFHVDHWQLPTAAAGYLYTLLSGQSPTGTANTTQNIGSLLYINLSASGVDMKITDPNNRRVGKNFPGSSTVNEVPGTFYSGSNSASEYAVLPNPIAGQYRIETKGTGSYRLSAYCVDASGTVATSTTETISSGQTGTATLTFAASPCDLPVVSFPPPSAGDTDAPTITITTPENGGTYQKTATVVPAATITDVSSIATTTYKFNNTVVNPALPLPLSTAPVGSATLVVSATDSSGNTGYATSTFTIGSATPDTQGPSITITNPLKYGMYERSDTVYPTATITDASGIATSTYWLNGKRINPVQKLTFNSSTPFLSKLSVSAKDTAGNSATSTIAFFVVRNKSNCLIDIVAIFIALTQDNTLPDKPTIQNLIADCKELLKGHHRWDWH